MGFVMAALSNTSFLCGAIVVTAVVMMLSDLTARRFTLHLWDISELLLVLLVARYLHCTGADDKPRGLIKGMLFSLVMMLSIMYAFG